MKEEFVSRQQVNLLAERIRKAEETNATQELYSYIDKLSRKNNYKPMNILIVGSGGSYPAALFAKHALHYELRTPYIEAVTPQTAIRIITQFDDIVACDNHPKYDLVIGISYSGKTQELQAVSRLCVKKGYPFVLLTGAEKSTLSELYSESDSFKIVSYFNPEDTTGREKGLISMASTLAPMLIFDDFGRKMISYNQECLVAGQKFVAGLELAEIAKALKASPVIHVFYEWDTLPAAADIESKFTESGVAHVILHEKKNFAHGRSTPLYNQDFALVINLTRYDMAIGLDRSGITQHYKNDYDKILAELLTKICEDKSAHYLEIGNMARLAAEWNIDVMTILPYLITAIGEEMDIDISKPLKPYPKEAIPIYDYTGEF